MSGAAKAPTGFTYSYPRPSVTADAVVITREAVPRVLLIRRRHDPFAGSWALPGGFIEMDETLVESARRELKEETGLTQVHEFAQFATYGDPGRDPRGRTISVVYVGRLDHPPAHLAAADDAAELSWHALDQLPPLAFDHARILSDVRRQLGL